MMNIISRVPETEEKIESKWWVGREKPMSSINCYFIIEEVRADGDELTLIRNKFKNLPDRPDRDTICWTGDFAQFIVSHLFEESDDEIQNNRIWIYPKKKTPKTERHTRVMVKDDFPISLLNAPGPAGIHPDTAIFGKPRDLDI